MSRRRRGQPIPQHAFGGHYDAAVEKVENLCERMVHARVTPDFKAKDIMGWLFPQIVLDACRTAKRYSKPYTNEPEYPAGVPDAVVRFNVDKIGMLPPTPDYVDVQLGVQRLHAVAADIKRVQYDFAKALFVLEWLKDNATAGAIRNYWPTACALVPHGVIPDEQPVRFQAPKQNVGPMIPLFRETATLLSSALLLPADVVVPFGDRNFTLNFGEHTFEYPLVATQAPVEMTSPHMVYHFK